MVLKNAAYTDELTTATTNLVTFLSQGHVKELCFACMPHADLILVQTLQQPSLLQLYEPSTYMSSVTSPRVTPWKITPTTAVTRKITHVGFFLILTEVATVIFLVVLLQMLIYTLKNKRKLFHNIRSVADNA